MKKQILLFLFFSYSFTQVFAEKAESNTYIHFLKTYFNKDWSVKIDSMLHNSLAFEITNPILNKCIKAYISEENENYSESVSLYFELLQNKKLDSQLISQIHKRLGVIFYVVGSYPESLEHYLSSLYMQTQKEEISILHQNIGALYHKLGDFDKAKIFYEKSLKFERSQNNYIAIAGIYNNIGALNFDSEKYNDANLYYRKAENIYNQKQDYSQLGQLYNNLGIIYGKLEQYDSAFYYYQKGLDFNSRYGKKIDVANSNIQIGTFYIKQGDLQSAITQLEKAKQIAIEIKSQTTLLLSVEKLAAIYSLTDNYILANLNLQIQIKLQKELNNKEAIKKITQTELHFQYKKEREKRELQIQKQRILLWAIIGITALIIFLLISLYRNYSIKKRDNILLSQKNNEIEQQKNIIIEQKKNITDSIQCASDIQQKMLPKSILINEIDYFIFFKPKDIVSGDFYWMHQFENITYFVVADCTGHGVPGALISMLGISFIKEIILQNKEQNTNIILEKLREYVIKYIGESSNGMDLGLLKIDTNQKKLQYSGANRPLFFIENNQLSIINPDRFSVSKTDHLLPFTMQELQYNDNTKLYLFSDGYPDQFGGPNNKKFLISNFKKLLLEAYPLSIKKQEELICSKLEEWKCDNEQIDDITVVGISLLNKS